MHQVLFRLNFKKTTISLQIGQTRWRGQKLIDFILQYIFVIFWRQLHKNAASNTEQLLEVASHKAAAVRPLTNYH